MAASSQAIFHGSLHNTLSHSSSPKSETLSSFNLLPQKLRNLQTTHTRRICRRTSASISAKRAAHLELLPVSPDDDTQVTNFSYSYHILHFFDFSLFITLCYNCYLL